MEEYPPVPTTGTLAGEFVWLLDRDEKIFVPDAELTKVPQGDTLIFTKGFTTTAAVGVYDGRTRAHGWISLHRLGYRDVEHAISAELPEMIISVGEGVTIRVPSITESCTYMRILNARGTEIYRLTEDNVPCGFLREFADMLANALG